MSTLLDMVRAQIEPLEARLDLLRQVEDLALRLDDGEGGAAEPKTPTLPRAEAPRPATSRRPAIARRVSPNGASPAAGRDGLGPKTQRVLDVLRERGDWMTPKEIAEQIDGTASGIRDQTKILRARGLVEAEGATINRRYRAADGRSALRERTDNGKALAAQEQLDGLARVSLADKVLKAVLAAPDGLSEAQIADTVGTSVDHTLQACAWLRERGRLTRHPDGTHRRPGAPTPAS